jgi:hypothetical protein
MGDPAAAAEDDAARLFGLAETRTKGRIMPATVASLTRTDGFDQFFCPLCAAVVFNEEVGMAEKFCAHVQVFVDWVDEAHLPEDATVELSENLDEIDTSDPSELASLFGDDTVVFELVEPGRGGGHDTSTCLSRLGSSISR